jgi:deoxyribonuclease V
MRIPRAPHTWHLTPRSAIIVQRRLASMVSMAPNRNTLRFVAGLDAAFSQDGTNCLAGVVLWDALKHCVIEQHTAVRPVRFPYVPGLLSFREAPALLAALRKLRRIPDLLLCDGQGRAHPRRFGIACHLGVLCDLPAIGCAKSRLTGTHEEVPMARGSHVPLLDDGEPIGDVVRTKEGCRPLYVSAGHRVSSAQARKLVLATVVRHRLPEPTRLADRLVARVKRAVTKTG